jgi:Uncharacterized conserved protein, contains double-stranded beta-helix domain
MKEFPEFMKSQPNHIDSGQQNTKDIDGYYYTANDGSQMAFWTCHSDQVSKPHKHPFDEYTIVVSGQYTAIIDGKEIILNSGDEIFVPKGTLQGGKCIAGTRTISAFGGNRIKTNL